MTTFERFSLENIPHVPWKNGGGTTREIACSPRGASMVDFDWRVSVADVRSDGAFSVFEGIDRTIALLDGHGMLLANARATVHHALTHMFAPFSFRGEEPIAATLLDGPTLDFNVMTRRGVCEASVFVISRDTQIPDTENAVVFATRGTWHVEVDGLGGLEQAGTTITRHEGIVWQDAPLRNATLRCDASRNAAALIVLIRRTLRA
jgi:uncharacterized protein